MENIPYDAPRCDRCGEILGVYEPVTVLAAGVPRETSVAAEPSLATYAGRRFHPSCFAAGGGGADEIHRT